MHVVVCVGKPLQCISFVAFSGATMLEGNTTVLCNVA